MKTRRRILLISGALALIATLIRLVSVATLSHSQAPSNSEHQKPQQSDRTQGKLSPLVTLPEPVQRKTTAEDTIAKAPIIESRTLPQDATGRYTKQKLVQWQGKYPLLRIEEDYEHTSTQPSERRFMVADHLIVKKQAEFTHDQLLAWVQANGLTIRRYWSSSGLYLIALPSGALAEFDASIAKLNAPNSPVEYAESDPLRLASSTPNDSLFPSQWALHNLSQTGGNPNADVDAPEAWNTTRGNDSLVVAVLDSGLDINHPDLRPNLWINTAEIPANNLDDDADGLIDNVNGWNFYTDNKDLTDFPGHGTHCAGIIGAVANNASGISGIAPQVKLMPLVVMDQGGFIVTSDAVAAMNFAVSKKVFITSNSYGGTQSSRPEKAAIDAALAQGILVVCAAGNDYPAKNIDTAKLYPASYSSANIISVAATTDIDTRAAFSNFGPSNVDLGAPGIGILSTLPNGRYGYESGTSMACPLVAGACVLVKAAHPDLNGSDIKSAILNSVDPLPSLKGRVKTGGRLNAARAIKIGTQPVIELSKTELRDAKLLGANGNNDGIFNAGEDITVATTIKNIGPLTTADVATRLTLRQTAGDVTLLRDAFSWGALRAGTSMTNNTAKALPFLLRISPTAPPQQVTLVFTHNDTSGDTWTSEATFSIAGSHTLSGSVTLLTGGRPVKGATITYSGPVTGTTTTATDGTYRAQLPSGTYIVTAHLRGYEPSPSQQVTLPPSMAGLNFTLGRSALVATPAALNFKQQEQARTIQTLTLSNKGDLPLNLTIHNSSLNNAIHPGFLNIPSYGAARAAQSALAPLPWQDGFESGTSSLVPSRYYEEFQEEDAYYIYTYIISYYLGSSSVVTNTAAVGRRSLHYRDPWFAGFDNGMQRRFAKATQPRYISYWVRPGSSTGTSGCFSLEDGFLESSNKKWYWRPIISVVAEEGGKLSVNGSLPSGDSSVPFTPKTWHFIELRNINWISRTFDYWVNGSQIKTAISFMGHGVSAARVHIYNNTLQGESWWDEMRVLDQDNVWLNHTPSTLSLAPGASETVSVTASSENHRPGVFRAQLNCFSNDPVRPVLNVPVTMTVTPHPNTAPVTNHLSATTPEDTTITLTLPAQDAEADPLTFYVATRPKRGKLMIGTTEVLSFPAKLPGNTITYLPPPHRSGNKLESFSYHVLDYRRKSKTSTVTLNVTPVNDAPIAGNDSQHLTRPVSTTINILANDYDVEGSPLTPTLISQPTRGKATLNADNTLTYRPDDSFEFGTDQFSYRISDGQGQSGTGQITIHMGQLESPDWPTFGGSNERNGSSIARLSGRPLLQQWSATLGTTALRQAAIVGGRAFVSSANKFNEPSFVASLDLMTGQLLWKQPLPVAFITGSVTVTDTHVYVTQTINHYSSAGILWCLDVDTGSIIWQSPFIGAQQESSAPAAFGDDVIVLTSIYDVESAIRFDGDTGVEIQRYSRETNKDQSVSDAPCISAGKIILPPSSGHFQSHDLLTGELTPKPTSNPRPEITGPVLTALGKTVWTSSPYSSSRITLSKGTSTTFQSIDGRFQGIPASDGTVVCAINRDELQATLYDQNTLKLLRTYSTSGKQSYYQPLLLADAVLLSDTTTSISVFNRQTAQLLQTLPVGGILSVGQGFLLASGYNGTLTAWTAPDSIARAPVARAQTVTGTEDTPLVITLSGTDANIGTRLTASISTLPASGTLWQTADGITPSIQIRDLPARVTHSAAKVILVPAVNAFGTAQTQFDFRVHDGRQSSTPARITVNLAPTPDSPIANNDRLFVHPDQTTLLRPLVNDLEPDGEVMQITSLSQPDFGSVTLNTDSSVSVLCNAQDYGRSFVLDYVVSDSTDRTSQATLTVIVAGPRPDEWPYPDNTAGNLRYYPGPLGESGHTLRWSYPLAGTGESAPPIIAEGNVFIVMSSSNSSSRPEIRAIDLVTGAEKWRVPMPGPAQLAYKSRYCPYMSYANGALFVLDGQSTTTQPGLVCLNAADGSLRWRRDDEKLETGQPLRILGSLVIAVTRTYHFGVVAFNVADGSKVWNYTSATSSQSFDWLKTGISQESLFTQTGGQFSQHSLIDGSIVSSRSLIREGEDVSSNQISNRDMVLDHGLALLYRSNPRGARRMYAVDVNSPPAAGYSSLETSFNALPVSVDSSVLVPTFQSTIRVLSPTLQDSGTSYPATATGNNNSDMDLIVAKDVVLARINSGLSVLRRSDRQITHTFSRPNMTMSKVCVASGRVVAYALPSNSTQPRALDCYSAQIVGNHPPIATAQTLTLPEEGEVTLNLTATDADSNPLLYSVLSLPAKGTLYQTSDGTTRGAPILNVPALVTDPSGRLIFEGSLDRFGAEAGSFTFAAFDPSSSSSTAEITIDITASNDPPEAISDSVTLRKGKSLTAFVPQANDRDYDGDVLTIVTTSTPTHGTVTLAPDGLSLTYTPELGYINGSDSFDYTIRDAAGIESTATVFIEINSFGAPWMTDRANPSRNSFVPTRLGTAALQLRWSGKLPVSLEDPTWTVSEPIVANGHFLVGDSSYHLIALDAATGSQIWRTPIDNSSISHNFSWSSSRLYLLNSAGQLQAFNDSDGTSIWSFKLPALSNPNSSLSRIPSPAVVNKGIYVAAGTPAKIYQVSQSGTAGFSSASTNVNAASNLTVQDNSILTSTSYSITSFDATSGTTQWSIGSSESIHSNSLCYGEQNIAFFITTHPYSSIRSLMAVDRATQQIKWQSTLREPASYSYAPIPSTAHQAVFAQSGSQVIMFEAATGRILRAFPLPSRDDALIQGPIITSDTVIAPTRSNIYVFNLHTTALQQTISISNTCLRVLVAEESIFAQTTSANPFQCYSQIDPTNAPPSALPITLSANEDEAALITLAGIDAENDPLIFEITTLPPKGKLYQTTDGITLGAEIRHSPARVTDPLHRIIYQPTPDHFGAPFASFTFRIADGNRMSNPATVTLNINAVDDSPTALSDAISAQPGQVLSPLPILGNDYDLDLESLEIVSFSQPSNGTLSQNADGSLRYQAPASINPFSSTSFTYTIQDSSGAPASAVVTIQFKTHPDNSWPMHARDNRRSSYAPGAIRGTGWTERWRVPKGSDAITLVADDTQAYITTSPTSQPRALEARSLATGALIWNRPINAYPLSLPLVAGGSIYLQSGSGSDRVMEAFSTTTGLTQWTSNLSVPFSDKFFLSPLIYGSQLIAPGSTHYLRMSLETGVRHSSRFFATEPSFVDRWSPCLNGDSLIFHAVGRLHVDSLDRDSQWSIPLSGASDWQYSPKSVSTAGNLAFAIDNSKKLTCINLTTRSIVWSVGPYTGLPALRGNEIYANFETGYLSHVLHALSIKDGSLLRTYNTATWTQIASQPVVTDNLLIAQSSSKISFFDLQTGTLLESLSPTRNLTSHQPILAGETLLTHDFGGNVIAYAPPIAITFSPSSGTFSSPQNITLTASDAGATIHYTTDGSAPNLSSATVANGGSVMMDQSGMLRAISVNGSTISRIIEATYTIGTPSAASAMAFKNNSSASRLSDSLAAADFDKDGRSDLAEAVAGTDPRNPSDVFKINRTNVLSADGASLSLSWPSKVGRNYRVQCSNDLQTWLDISPSIHGTGTEITHQFAPPSSGPCFLRVRIE